MALEKIINPGLVKALFSNSHEHVKFAFVGNHIERYRNIRNTVSIKFKSNLILLFRIKKSTPKNHNLT
jgi:hypothetical protein